MLSELNDILDRLQTGNFPDNAKQQRAGRMMKDLNDVVSDQQKLLDDTFAEKRKRPQGQGGGGGDQFEVSPPPMDFGPGMSMTPFSDKMPQSGQGGPKAQGQSGRQGNAPGGGKTQLGQSQGQQQGSLADLQKRQKALRNKLQSLIDRMRMEGGDASNAVRGRQERHEGCRRGARRAESRSAPPRIRASRSTACAKARSPWPNR